jgi:type VI secretion system lysozyme-like protein
MPIQRSLLERIRNPDPPGLRRAQVSASEVFDSILANLQNLLNTCQGNCLTDERYGLPHLSGVRSTMPGSVASYEAAIRRTIERNEPRLTGVRVRHTPLQQGRTELRFEITGMIVDEQGRRSVRFETLADEDGRIRVR